MATAKYYRADGQTGDDRALPDELFGVSVNQDVLHTVVTAHLANRRQGTAAGKNRAKVRGGSRKPWRQKGTGRARQGTTRAAQWTGGGRAFPPQPHSWRRRIPKKVKALARRSALSARAAEGRVAVIDPLSFEAPSTRRLVRFLEAIGVRGKVLILTDGVKDNVVLSGRNVPTILVRPFGQESTYDILWSGTVVVERTVLGEAADSRGEAPAGPRADDGGIAAAPEGGEEADA
ncbi:MAG: 50S ribosomal protein L4 [Gammaproteobacteria bacterium]|nr:50S ribosomal protein L4 [Gammaproteobacteria bacterium]